MSENKRRGFTLIELSIVLVIIGLVAGGVLVGQMLIKTAEIRSQVSQFGRFNTAVNTFKIKYNGVPGDITNDVANGFGLFAGGGNGDGLIEDVNGKLHPYSLWAEPLIFFIHLSEANLIDGNYRYVMSAYNMGQQYPEAKLGKGGIIGFTQMTTMKLSYYLGISISGVSLIDAADPIGVITPYEAYALDDKMDDGKPATGAVRAAIHTFVLIQRPTYALPTPLPIPIMLTILRLIAALSWPCSDQNSVRSMLW